MAWGLDFFSCGVPPKEKAGTLVEVVEFDF